MCPLSGMMQLFVLLVSLLLLCQGIFAQVLKCEPKNPTIHMSEKVNITCDITGVSNLTDYELILRSEDTNIVKADEAILLETDRGKFTFSLSGEFLGKTLVHVRAQEKKKVPPTDLNEETIEVIVIRKTRPVDTAFTVSVAVLVGLTYVNFGCALKWDELKRTVKRPVGPAIGFIGQFLFMPLLSFGIGKLLFPGNVEMQLGMFFTGISPGGGASNMWTVILGGNIDLSITMTTISTVAAFAMIPLWLFTLGKVLFDQGKMEVPYVMISEYVFALVVPLFIGFLIQRYMKRTAAFLVRILKGLSTALLVFIVVFAIVTNLYLFQLFSWEIIVAGLGLPWLGYMIAFLLAYKQPPKDRIVIAIETGIQNTGISIFMLRFSLGQPAADLTTVVPVCVAIMTPLPLLCIYIYQKIRTRCGKLPLEDENPKKISGIDGPEQVMGDINAAKVENGIATPKEAAVS